MAVLSEYCKNVLASELAGPDYDGKTADQAWDWLMVPVTASSQADTHLRLTPLVAAAALGPLKANALAAKVAAALPAIAASLMAQGVDLSDPATGQFLDVLVDGSSVLQVDVDALKALGRQSVALTTPRRFDRRFEPALWPHVAADGTAGADADQAIHGFPNDISRPDFDAAWQQARGG